jgi:hypothetical protein
VVAGKTIKSAPDWSAATVFLPSGLWPAGSDQWEPFSTVLVAHELAHAFLGSLRKGEPGADFDDDHALARGARLIPQYAVDEIRADVMASTVLDVISTVTLPDGTTRPATSVDVVGEVYVSTFGEILDALVHPGWPDLVASYREREIDLDTLLHRLGTQIDEVMNALAHAHSESVIGGTDHPLDVYAAHPGVELYLGPAWRPLVDALAEYDLIPEPADLLAADRQIGDMGIEHLTAMWAKLGVRARPLDDGMYVDVTEPLR